MPKYQLIYFNARALGEVARLLFAEAGVEYEDTRLEFDEWLKMKPGEFHFRTLSLRGHLRLSDVTVCSVR